jgi:hypothetical protein
MSVVLVVLLCTVTGCRGSAAQEPYDGAVAAPRASMAAAAAVQAPQPEPSDVEINVPWAIALLSDAPAPPTRKPIKPAVAARNPDLAPAIAPEAHVHVAIESQPVSEKPAEIKPATPKVCSGVVNRRS